jgi:SAM-dependent methyltransferase
MSQLRDKSQKKMREKWDERYRASSGQTARAARVLVDYRHLLPAHGEALDLACGLGGNALFLAQSGLQTQAWDLSPVAIEALRDRAAKAGLSLKACVHDVVAEPPLPASFDVIVVSYFLARSLAPLLCAALRPGGLLFYQTFVRDKVSAVGPANPDYLLGENELLKLFTGLRLRVYREEGSIGDTSAGLRNEAMLVAQQSMT